MKRLLAVTVMVFALSVFIFPLAGAEYKGDTIDKIRLIDADIPQGFVYGSVPPFAKKVLKGNPWKMDREAIKRLAGKIYPDGNYMKIEDIHVSILARNSTPYGDDIVCYIIVYKNISESKPEIKKIMDYAGFNRDRVIVLSRENMVVFLHVDDVTDFPLIRDMARKIEDRLNQL